MTTDLIQLKNNAKTEAEVTEIKRETRANGRTRRSREGIRSMDGIYFEGWDGHAPEK